MTFGWHLESIGIEFYLECVGMAHGMGWNVLEWLECVGMPMECTCTITCVNFANLNELGPGKGLWAYL